MTILTDRFENALIYATQLHAKQVRKSSHIPYISHLLSVCALVLEDGGDEDEAIAALLHDAIEDQGGDKTRQEIKQKFGDKVAEIVEGCTDSDTNPKPPWQERKTAYIEKFRHASPAIRRVSLSDKLHNARSILADYRRIKDEVWTRFKGHKEGTLWYYDSLIEAAKQSGEKGFLLQELERTIQQLHDLSSLK
jgi:(p)ppGpp synthase/HD superfamily hydrolase